MLLSRCRHWIARARQRPVRLLAVLTVLALLGLGAYRTAGYVQARYVAPRRHYRAALAAMDRRQFGEARKQLAVCLEAWPDDAAVHFLAARAARRAGDLDEAQEQLFLCQHLEEATGDTTVGDTRLEWALQEAQAGNLLKVEQYLRNCLGKGHPDSLQILEVMSWQLMWAYRFKEAEYCLDLWLQRQPDDPEALVRRGWVLEHLQDLQAAVRDYGKALAINPEQDNVRLRIADLLLQSNRPAEALEPLQRLRERQPDNPAVLVSLARCQRLLGSAGEAVRLLDGLLAAHPDNAQALSERGLLALEAGQAAEAERLLRQAADRDPSDRQVGYNLYSCLERLGKKEEASKVTARLGQVDAEVKRMDQLMRAVMKTPHAPALRYEVGLIFLRNGFTEDGLRWLGMALAEDPGYRPAHQALAEYYERAGKPERALPHRQFLQQTEGRVPTAAVSEREFSDAR